MDAFFLSALVSFGLTLLLMASAATVTGGTVKLRLGSSLELTAARRLFIFVASLVAIFLVVFLFLIVVARIHPQSSAIYRWGDFLAGPIFSSVVLGLLFGVLFAFWLRELLRLPEKEAIQKRHVVQAIVLAILLGLGTFSDAIRSYASRIAQISFGGAQVSFTPGTDTRDKTGPAGQQASSTGGGSASSANAFLLIKNLPNRIKSDSEYISEVFAQANPSSKVPRFFGMNSAVAACLMAAEQVGGDLTTGRYFLHELLAVTRQIEISQGGINRGRVVRRLSKLGPRLADELARGFLRFTKNNSGRAKVEAACTAFLVWACPPQPKEADENGSYRFDLGELASTCEERWFERKGKISAAIDELLAEDALFDRPHIALLAAGLLWSLDQHREAALELDTWIGQHWGKDAPLDPARIPHPWYEARTRIYLVLIVEDWLRGKAKHPPGLVEYHVENLATTASLMRYLLKAEIAKLGDLPGDLEAEDFAKGLPPSGFKCNGLDQDRVQLLLTWLSLYPTYMVRATQSSDYESYLDEVMTARREFLKRDVLCLANLGGDSREAVEQLYADFLQAYAEVEMVNAERVAHLPDQDAARRMIDRASHAAALGLRIIQRQANKERISAHAHLAGSLEAQIEPSDNLDIEERLKSVRDKALDRLK